VCPQEGSHVQGRPPESLYEPIHEFKLPHGELCLTGIIDAPDNASGSAPSISSLPNAYSPARISSRLTALTSTLVLALSSAVRILFTQVHCSIHSERNVFASSASAQRETRSRRYQADNLASQRVEQGVNLHFRRVVAWDRRRRPEVQGSHILEHTRCVVRDQ
jgi:hypothetical protein